MLYDLKELADIQEKIQTCGLRNEYNKNHFDNDTVLNIDQKFEHEKTGQRAFTFPFEKGFFNCCTRKTNKTEHHPDDAVTRQTYYLRKQVQLMKKLQQQLEKVELKKNSGQVLVICSKQEDQEDYIKCWSAIRNEVLSWGEDNYQSKVTKDMQDAYTFAQELRMDRWKVARAPWPSDIDWDNYFYDGHWILVWLKVSMLNLFILLVVLVFATPTILWESMKKMSAVGKLIEE